jgi:hypothetical protein
VDTPGSGRPEACRRGQYSLSVGFGRADVAVIDSSGALLFLDPAVAQALDDKALDAHSDADGTLRYTVEDQAS